MLLLVPRLLALDLAPRIRGRPAARALAFAAAERMIDGVHRHAADAGAAAQPAGLPRLADRQQLVLGVPYFADRRETLAAHHPHFRRAEPQRDVIALFRDDLRAGPGAAAQLAAATDLQLDIVHRGAERDFEQRHRIPDPDVRTRPRDDAVADAQPLRRDDVALLTVGVVQQRDARGPVRIVLDGRDARRNGELVAAEIDAPVLPLVATAHIPARDVALVVAPARPPQRLEQRLLRLRLGDFGEVGDRAEARGRRHRPKLSDAHLALEHLNSVALFEGHDRLFPGWPAALVAPVRAPLGPHDHRADAGDRHLEQRFDRRLDLRLGRLGVHAERVLLARAIGRGRLLRDHGADDGFVQLRHRSPPAWPRLPRTRRSPPSPSGPREIGRAHV